MPIVLVLLSVLAASVLATCVLRSLWAFPDVIAAAALAASAISSAPLPEREKLEPAVLFGCLISLALCRLCLCTVVWPLVASAVFCGWLSVVYADVSLWAFVASSVAINALLAFALAKKQIVSLLYYGIATLVIATALLVSAEKVVDEGDSADLHALSTTKPRPWLWVIIVGVSSVLTVWRVAGVAGCKGRRYNEVPDSDDGME